MRIVLAAVGRDRNQALDELFGIYRRRCPWPIDLIEIGPQGVGPRPKRMADEAAKLLRAVPSDAVLIALDEHGQELDSRDFAQRLQAFRSEGARILAFVIGGAEGLDATVLKRARLTLAFGRMTWPHRLVRVMLMEQLYRAGTILEGHPYHRA